MSLFITIWGSREKWTKGQLAAGNLPVRCRPVGLLE